ncbi:MAG: GIY-YIG nuclease family protein, partial [Pseudomonadota bacterium]
AMCAAYAKWQEASDGNQGYLYVLVNPAFRSNFLKIGKTTRTPSERAEEISLGTGVPLRFYVAYEALVSDCHAVERIVHERLRGARSTTNREFFEVPLKDAIRIISEVASQFAPNRSVQPTPTSGRG